MDRLRDKVAVITGGAGNIGFTTARLFVEEGAKVVLADLDESALRERAAELGHGSACYAVTDVTNAAQVQGAVAAATARFGRLDVVFSNAGVFGAFAPVAEYPEDVFDQVMAVNIRGNFLVSKYALQALADGGSLIINSSVVGLTSAAGICGYATAKHALVGLMRTAAHEAAPRGIRVNTIHPGPVDNAFQHTIETTATGEPEDRAATIFESMIPLSRHAAAGEIARAVVFLASDDSTFMTGATLAVDGGMSI